MAISHADCTHPRTPAGRRACRAGNAAPVVIVPDDYITPAPIRRARAARLQARLDSAADGPRIQPRRSGARVAAGASTCVQAALHTSGKGLCACGHVSGGFVRRAS